MKQVRALVGDTFREASSSFVLVGFAALSTLFLLIVLFAVNLDVVNGTLAAGSLFGKSVDFGGKAIPVEQFVFGVEAGFSAALYLMGMFLSIFAVGSVVPRQVEKGNVDLYLSRPVSRTKLLLSRYLGGLAVAAVNLGYLSIGIWLILSTKTHVWNVRFLVAGLFTLATIAAFEGFVFLLGVVTGSTPISIMLPYFLFFASAFLSMHKQIAAALSSDLSAGLIHVLYWILPKTADIGKELTGYTHGDGQLTALPLLTTIAFGAVCLTLSVLIFRKRDY